MMLRPATVSEVCNIVRSTDRVLPIGARTKPRLSAVPSSVALVSMTGLRGIVEYDPGEFTFTALAGTPLRDIAAALDAKGQYLPFDPPFVESGATIGGTVAAGLSGPGRFRYGGLRDFILAVQFVDGSGNALRAGAKVVKNAAGFDVPKFLAGSLGRLGILTEVTFKVFPRPTAETTLAVRCRDLEEVADVFSSAACSRWELDALEYSAATRTVLARLRGPDAALAPLAEEITQAWPGARALDAASAAAAWQYIGEMKFAPFGGLLAKVPLTIAQMPALEEALKRALGFRYYHAGCAGNVAYIYYLHSTRTDALHAALSDAGLRGVVLRGDGGPLWLGNHPQTAASAAVKTALDPENRFPALVAPAETHPLLPVAAY